MCYGFVNNNNNNNNEYLYRIAPQCKSTVISLCCQFVKLHPSVIVRKIVFSRVVSSKFIHFCFKWDHKLLFTTALKKNVECRQLNNFNTDTSSSSPSPSVNECPLNTSFTIKNCFIVTCTRGFLSVKRTLIQHMIYG